jgi:hypothetical protein
MLISYIYVKVAYNNIFRMLLSVKRWPSREVYGAYVRLNVDSLQVVSQTFIYAFIQRLRKSKNCLITFAIGDCARLCFDPCVFIYFWLFSTFNSKRIQPNRMTFGGMIGLYPMDI